MSRRWSEAVFHGITEKELAELIEDVFPPQETDMATETVHEPMKRAPLHEMIGFLTRHPSGKGHGFLCFNCAAVGDAHVGAPVYGVNLNPYKATCVCCKRVIVQGCGTELFDGS